jgi:hypothetical protein
MVYDDTWFQVKYGYTQLAKAANAKYDGVKCLWRMPEGVPLPKNKKWFKAVPLQEKVSDVKNET